MLGIILFFFLCQLNAQKVLKMFTPNEEFTSIYQKDKKLIHWEPPPPHF